MIIKKIERIFSFLKKILLPKRIQISSRQMKITRNFADDVVRSLSLEPDIILCHDSLASLAALKVKDKYPRAHIVMDITEIPVMKERLSVNLRSLTGAARSQFKRWEFECIEASRGIYSLSEEFCSFLKERYQRDVKLLRSLKESNTEESTPDYIIKRHGLSADDIILVFPGQASMQTGALEAIKAVALLPANVKLVFLGTVTNKDFHNEMKALVSKLGLEGRIVFDQAYYSGAYHRYLGACDIALIVFDTQFLQSKLVLPNRFLDCVAARIPVVVTDVNEIRNIIEQYGTGTAIKKNDPKAIAEAVQSMIGAHEITANKQMSEDMRSRLDKLSADMDEEKDFDHFADDMRVLVGEKVDPHVLFLARQDISGNMRMIAQCNHLIERGFTVEVCSLNNPMKVELLSDSSKVLAVAFYGR